MSTPRLQYRELSDTERESYCQIGQDLQRSISDSVRYFLGDKYDFNTAARFVYSYLNSNETLTTSMGESLVIPFYTTSLNFDDDRGSCSKTYTNLIGNPINQSEDPNNICQTIIGKKFDKYKKTAFEQMSRDGIEFIQTRTTQGFFPGTTFLRTFLDSTIKYNDQTSCQLFTSNLQSIKRGSLDYASKPELSTCRCSKPVITDSK